MSTRTPYVVAALLAGGEDPLANLIKFETFNDGVVCGVEAGYWTEVNVDGDYYSPNTAQEVYEEMPAGLPAPFDTGCGVNYFLENAAPSDVEPFRIQKYGAPLTEVFLRWYEYYSPGFIWPAGQKMARFVHSDGGGAQVQFQFSNAGSDPQQWISFATYNGDPLFGDTQYNLPEDTPLGVWNKFEIYGRDSSDASVADGRVTMLLNDVVISDANNVITRTGSLGWDGFWIGGNASYNGSGPGGYTQVPQDQHRYISPIQVFSALPSDVILP